MEVRQEVEKTRKMIEAAGFKVSDMQFEGVVDAGNEKVTEVLEAMSKEQKAIGVLRVFYDAGGSARVIEIPLGEMPPPEMPPAEGH